MTVLNYAKRRKGARYLTIYASALSILILWGAASADEPPKAIGIHAATFGAVEKCEECGLFEFDEEGTRRAYFARPEPDCVLHPVHVKEVQARIESKDLVLILSETGGALLSTCVPSEELSRVVVTVRGTPVGTGIYFPLPNLIAIRGGAEFDLLVSLFPKP